MPDNSLNDTITVEAAFISANAASYIASTYTANVRGTKPPTLTLERSCLRSLNAFLDYFLAIIIKDARSIGLQDLKATLTKILDSALGYVALNEAQAELETYRNQETGAGRSFDHPTSGSMAANELFDVEAVWLQARIRCMIYSTVGEKEETDFPTLSNDSETAVTPPVAIFLTAILEFLGEHILLTSARFARDRIGSSTKGLLTEDDLDRGVKMDKALGTIWQSYLTIIPRQPEVLRKRDSDATDGSTTERIFTTLPFTSTKHTEIAGGPRNMDQYEQSTNPTESTRTPVLLRKASPNLPAALPGKSEERQMRSTVTTTTNDPSSPLSESAHLATEPEPLQTIPETSHQSESAESATLSSGMGYDSYGTTNPLQPHRSPGPNVAQPVLLSQVEAGGIPEMTKGTDTTMTRSVASSVYGGNNESIRLEPPLVSNGLWSRRTDQDASGQTGKTLWIRPESSVRRDTSRSASSAKDAPSHVGASTAEGFESGLFSWNANRESTSATSTPQKKTTRTGEQESPLTARSPFRDVYETVYAEQVKLSPRAPSEFQPEAISNTAITTAHTNSGSREQKDKHRVPPTSLGDVSRTETDSSFAPRKTVNISIVKPKTMLPVSPREVPSDFGSRQGLGIRQLSDIEPGSDYEVFLRSEMAREKDTRTGAKDADAQRGRILANRAAALATPQRDNKDSTASHSMQNVEPVQNPSTPPANLTLTNPLARKSSNPSQPRSPTTSTEPSQTLRLAEFLRTTGPERSTPRAVPLMSVAPARTVEKSSPTTKPEEVFSRPVKLVKSETRTPLDAGTDEDEDDAESWDEELYGPNPRQKKGETMTDFLKNVPPPASTEQPQRRASLLQKIPSLGGRANGKSNKVSPLRTDPVDELIAGPAYNSPKAETNTAPSTTSPRLGLFAPAVISPKQTQKRTATDVSADLINTTEVPRSPSTKTTKVRDQRAVSRNVAQSEEEEEDTLSDDDSIYGNPRRKPVKKESMAEFLKNTSPPGYGGASIKKNSRVDSIGASPPSGSIGRISRRISSLSVLVGGVASSSSKKNGSSSPATPNTTSPQRPNHRPLVP